MIQTPRITKERIKEYLKQGKRFDGRGLDEMREISIETGIEKNAEGSARVKIGKTEVLVGVKMAVSTPYDDSPAQGNLMVTAELLPMSSPRVELGKPGFPSIELGRVIDRGIRESKFIKLDKLCIKEGEKVWTVFVDIYSINDDGNLLDAAGIGAVAALANAKMPKYDMEAEKVIYGEWTEEKLALNNEIPVSLTVHKIGDSLILDPTREEEDVSETRVTMESADGKISSMQKGNSDALEIEEFEKILDMITKAEREVLKKIEASLK
jgi:exosome complex component RRP42